eukprot:5855369-Pleurochrysis_carterae.AAC.1
MYGTWKAGVCGMTFENFPRGGTKGTSLLPDMLPSKLAALFCGSFKIDLGLLKKCAKPHLVRNYDS